MTMTDTAAAPLAASDVPMWYDTMVSITGLTETPGAADNPKILAMRDYIAKTFPDQKKYCDTYQHDETPWCGLTMAYCMATCDISGPFGPTDTDRWMWAQSWANDPANYIKLGQPIKGCIVVMTRSGGGHVTLYEADAGSNIKCRGGNQGDMINVSSYAKSSVIAYVWPRSVPLPPMPRRDLKKGDTGPDVAEVQMILGLPADGDFGSITDSGVKQYQGACGLSKDGVVGSQTWAALDALDAKMGEGEDGISEELAAQIDALVRGSPIVNYSWPDRGRAPIGYYRGMAKAYAWALVRPEVDQVVAMSKAAPVSPDKDALQVYKKQLNAEELYANKDGVDTLRALYTMMIGLGMRESSGNHWCGRDMTASNVEADTCEAGSHQTSWNIASADPSIPPLLKTFWEDPNGFRPSFDDGVSPTASNLDAYGSGDGARYQFLAKYSPNFHVLVTGVGMRKRCNHWGPINRGEVTICGMAADLLLDVEELVQNEPEPIPPDPGPDPEPGVPTVTITVASRGEVEVQVVQEQPTMTTSTKATEKRQARKVSRAAKPKKKNGRRKQKRGRR